MTSICQGADDGTVGIFCDDMTKNWRHVVEQVYDEKDVVQFGRSGEDIERVVQVHSCEQATNVIGRPDASSVAKGSAQRPVGEMEIVGRVEERSTTMPDMLAQLRGEVLEGWSSGS